METPDEWKALADFIMGPVVKSWEELHFGFWPIDDSSDEARLSHAQSGLMTLSFLDRVSL